MQYVTNLTSLGVEHRQSSRGLADSSYAIGGMPGMELMITL